MGEGWGEGVLIKLSKQKRGTRPRFLFNHRNHQAKYCRLQHRDFSTF